MTSVFARCFVAVCAVGLWTAAVNAAVRNVPSTAYPTIQAGINAAAAGDTVLVANGTYTGNGNTNLDFMGKLITVRSSGGAANCIIDCQNASGRRGVRFVTGEPVGTVLQGFTIRRGRINAFGDGGGIQILGASPTIANCIIEDCVASQGGGVAIDGNSTVIIVGCTIRRNVADGTLAPTTAFGGGIYLNQGNLTVSSCVIDQNAADASASTNSASGGGIRTSTLSGSVWIRFTTISNNKAITKPSYAFAFSKAGGVMAGASMMRIDSCQIFGNQVINNGTGEGGGLFVYGNTSLFATNIRNNTVDDRGGGICYAGATLSLHRCDVSFNSAVRGGGLGAFSSGPSIKLTGCLVSNNHATSQAGGLQTGTIPTAISSCTIVRNSTSGTGGGIYIQGPTTVNNSIVWDNTASTGREVHALPSTTTTFGYCDVDNAAGDVSGTGTVTWGSGTIHASPNFINPVSNFRLAASSPCIDAGNNNLIPAGTPYDLDAVGRRGDDPAVTDSGVGPAPVVDMGAYERFGPVPYLFFIPWAGTGSPLVAGT